MLENSKKPKQGDIIKLNLNPTKGHEQKGYRPALVINNPSFSKASNMTIICPITNTNRNNPLHVELKDTETTGFIMCDQIKAVDLSTRDYIIIETINGSILWEVSDILKGCFEIE